MVNHAGFAAALTIRERLLTDALMLAHAAGDFPHRLRAALPDDPPPAHVDVHLDIPRLRCDESLNSLVLTLRVWGELSVTIERDTSTRQIDGQLLIRIRPRFIVSGSSLVLSPEPVDLTVTRWEFTVLAGGPFPDDVDQYVRSSFFRDRLQRAIRSAVEFGVIRVPPIDIQFLGDVATAARSPAAARVREGAVLVGLDVESENVTTSGAVDRLVDFARDNQLAAVTNEVALRVLFGDLEEKVRVEAEERDAILEDFSVTVEPGRFRVRAMVTKQPFGTATLSLALVPALFHTRPGRYFQYLEKPFVISDRTWPALDFSITDVDVSIDREDMIVFLEVVIAPQFLGYILYRIEIMISRIASALRSAIAATDTGEPTPRVRRQPAANGAATVRIELADYELTADETYVGVKVAAKLRPPALIGPRSIPDEVGSQMLSYAVRLPIEAALDDPALRLRWSVYDVASGQVLLNDDGPAAGRLAFAFVPSSVAPGLVRLGVGVRVYRPLGPSVTDLMNEGITLELTGPRAPGSYVRWRYGAQTPRVQFDEQGDTWVYAGDRVVARVSNLHRRDLPCANQAKSSRWTHETEILDALPFPVAELAAHRAELCDYCFFGGPDGLLASL